ncbi:MAG: hypothetical protein V4505_26300 [Pseudomonadota bacterium]
MPLKLKLKSFSLGNVLPYGWAPFPGKFGGGIMGHEFTMVGIFELVSEWSFSNSRQIFTLPLLEWREKEFWWERNGSGEWIYLGETDKGDLYQTAPGSPTWNGFAQGKNDVRDHTWISKPGSDIAKTLHMKLFSSAQQGLIATAEGQVATLKGGKKYRDLDAQANIQGKRNLSEQSQWWLIAENFASKHTQLPCAALDRPGMAKSGGSGASGGGFKSLTTSASRRRVLQFDLGIQGSATRFSATQVLETNNTEPSISKFIIPGMSDDWVKAIPEEYLAYWRSTLNKDNVEDQDTMLESPELVDAFRPEPSTPWVSGVIPRSGRARSNAVWQR